MQAGDGTCPLPQRSVESSGRPQDVFLQGLRAQWFRALLKEVVDVNLQKQNPPPPPPGRRGGGVQTQEIASEEVWEVGSERIWIVSKAHEWPKTVSLHPAWKEKMETPSVQTVLI